MGSRRIKYAGCDPEEINTQEKERLKYFQTVIKNLPGGIAVMSVRRTANDS